MPFSLITTAIVFSWGLVNAARTSVACCCINAAALHNTGQPFAGVACPAGMACPADLACPADVACPAEVACPDLPGAGKEEIAAAVARTRREERLAADQRLTQALQNQQQRLQQQQQQQQAGPARRQNSHMNVNLSDSSEVQALQRDLADALAR